MTAGDELIARHHRSSHRGLLCAEARGSTPHAAVEAVIVPATRPVAALESAVKLAFDLECVLVVLCSGSVTADQVLASAQTRAVSVVAVDMVGINPLPAFDTSEVVVGTRFERTNDVSLKRNLGLLFARVAGWQHVLFLDDDIDGLRKEDVNAAAGLLSRYDVVGFNNLGFPDNSVVCHVVRDLGHHQDQFIGAGALVLAPSRINTFFPNIYNEDWFFLLGAPRRAVTGSIVHRWRSRADDPDRARQEELGDCLAEGIFWLLGQRASLGDIGGEYWRKVLDRRRSLIETLGAEAARSPGEPHVTASIEAAYETCDAISGQPELCAGYVQLWHSDVRAWREATRRWPTGLGIAKALAELGWTGIARVHLSEGQRG